jgi:hypothetical protein
MYNVFTRTWWRYNPDWPNGLEPHLGRKAYIAKNVTTEKMAQKLCSEYNDNNDAGRLSRKAEYEGV